MSDTFTFEEVQEPESFSFEELSPKEEKPAPVPSGMREVTLSSPIGVPITVRLPVDPFESLAPIPSAVVPPMTGDATVYSPIGVPITIPKQMAAEQGAALYNVAKSVPEFMLSPGGTILSPLGESGALGKAALQGLFAGLAAKGGAEALGEASVTGDYQKGLEGALMLGSAPVLARPGTRLPVREEPAIEPTAPAAVVPDESLAPKPPPLTPEDQIALQRELGQEEVTPNLPTLPTTATKETPKITVGDLSKEKAIGAYNPMTQKIILDKQEIAKLSPDERASIVRHELAHKIETEMELWQQSDDYLWRLWESDRNHPIWDLMGAVTGRWKFDNAQSPEIIAELYANHYPKGTFTLKERPVPYEWEGEDIQFPKEYPIPPELMSVLDKIENKLGIWTKKIQRGSAEAKPPPVESGKAAESPPPEAASVSEAKPAVTAAEPQAISKPTTEVPVSQVDVSGVTSPEFPPGPGAMTKGAPRDTAIQVLTDQLNAAPPVGAREKLTLRERAADVWGQGKSEVARALGRTQSISQTLKETARGVRDINDLDRNIGNLDFLLQKSSAQSRINGKAIERQQPNLPTREAVAIWIDAGGDTQKIAATLANLPDTIRPNVRRALAQALNLSPEAKQFAEQLKQFYGIRAEEAISSDVFSHALEDYYTHIWQREGNMPERLRVALSNGRVNDYFQFARQRTIPTLLDGIQQGMNPVLDPAKIIPYYNYALDRAIASREFIKRLSEINAPDDRPAVLPNGTAIPVEKEGTPEALIINPRGKTELGKDYLVINHPSMRKWKWIGKDENGNPILYRGDLGVNPLLHQKLSRMLDRTRQTPTKAGAALLRVGSEVKAAKLAALPSLFHQVHVGSHALWHWTNPFKVSEIDWESPATRFAVEKGHLKIAANPSELANFSEGILGPGLVHKVPLIGPISKAYAEYLFNDWIPKLKLKTFENAYARNLRFYRDNIARGDITKEQLAARIGDSVNNAYGELNHWFLGKYGRAPEFQRLLRGIFLAPDFGEARLRFTEKAFTKFGHEERLAFGTMFVAMYLAARIGNTLTHGDPEWDPKRMFSVKVGKHWLSMRSVAGDVLHAMTNFGQFAYVRLNPVYSRTIADVLFQRDVNGRPLTMEQILLKRPAEQLIPINFSNLTRNDQSIWESFITSMGLQSRHDVPAFEVSKLVRQYMKDSDDPKLKAMGARLDQELFAPSDYQGLRTALKNDDLPTARDEYRKLLTEKGKKPKDIDQTMKPTDAHGKPKPFGPLSAPDYERFKRTLNAAQIKELDAAQAEREQMYRNYLRIKP